MAAEPRLNSSRRGRRINAQTHDRNDVMLDTNQTEVKVGDYVLLKKRLCATYLNIGQIIGSGNKRIKIKCIDYYAGYRAWAGETRIGSKTISRSSRNVVKAALIPQFIKDFYETQTICESEIIEYQKNHSLFDFDASMRS